MILVVDSTDRERLTVAKEELYKMLGHEVSIHSDTCTYCTCTFCMYMDPLTAESHKKLSSTSVCVLNHLG